jgi:hypothetical protein
MVTSIFLSTGFFAIYKLIFRRAMMAPVDAQNTERIQ